VSATTALQQSYWQHLARQINQIPGPVMLRPRLSASTAVSYRRAWKQMVRAFRQEKVLNAVWVWTPDANDALLQRFPGVAYVHWVANPVLARDGAPDYANLRTQLSQNLAMHQLPVLLLAPAANGSLKAVAGRLNAKYPEIKAVVFP
jgi:hypothetical protein